MESICGAKCSECAFEEKCEGCERTCGRPFGGDCVAAEYVKIGGYDAYAEFKKVLLKEINELLEQNSFPKIEKLYELSGKTVNVKYTLPNGEKVKFLDDANVYLGSQTELFDTGIKLGVVADTTFILVSAYGERGANPELL